MNQSNLTVETLLRDAYLSLFNVKLLIPPSEFCNHKTFACLPEIHFVVMCTPCALEILNRVLEVEK